MSRDCPNIKRRDNVVPMLMECFCSETFVSTLKQRMELDYADLSAMYKNKRQVQWQHTIKLHHVVSNCITTFHAFLLIYIEENISFLQAVANNGSVDAYN